MTVAPARLAIAAAFAFAGCGQDSAREVPPPPEEPAEPVPERIVGIHALDAERAVFVVNAPRAATQFAVALVTADGARKWRTPLPGKPPTAPEPGMAVIGDAIAVLHGDGLAVSAFDLATGAKRWTTSIPHETTALGGYQQPEAIAAGDLLVVGPYHSVELGREHAALDAKSGAIRWKHTTLSDGIVVIPTGEHIGFFSGNAAWAQRSDGIDARRLDPAIDGSGCVTARGAVMPVARGAKRVELVFAGPDPARDRVLGPAALRVLDCAWHGDNLFVVAWHQQSGYVLDVYRPGKRAERVAKLPGHASFVPPGHRGDVGSIAGLQTPLPPHVLFVDLDRRRIVRDHGGWGLQWHEAPIVVDTRIDFTTYGAIDSATGLMTAAFRVDTDMRDNDLDTMMPHHLVAGRLWIRGGSFRAPAPFAVLDAKSFAPIHVHEVALKPADDAIQAWNAKAR